MIDVFAHRVSRWTVVEIVADTAVCFAAGLIAFDPRMADRVVSAQALVADDHAFQRALLFALVMSLMYSFVGLYRRGAVVVSLWTVARRAFLAVLIGAAIAYAALVLDGRQGHAIELLGRAVCSMAIGVILVRGISRAARQSSLGVRRILVLGTGAEAQRVASDIRRAHAGRAMLVGLYAAGEEAASEGGEATVFPASHAIEQVVRQHRVREIVVAVNEQRGGACLPMAGLLACRTAGTRVLSLADFYEREHGEVPTEGLRASWLVFGHGFVQGTGRVLVKRCFDILFSSLLLLLASPVMVAAALAIRLQGPGPVIYRQERAGLGGRRFMCLKFRSMRPDAESDGVARWAVRNDARVTPVGAFLRRTRIDELPQLISVLRGDMSLVGPRPERPSFVAELRQTIPFYDIRHSVKPGLTGWAQVRYGYCATHEDARKKHQFDLYYIKNNTLLLDLLVLIETVSVVLFREGSQ